MWLIYFRLYVGEDAWITFRGVKLLWFNGVIKVPAFIENKLGNVKREPWGD